MVLTTDNPKITVNTKCLFIFPYSDCLVGGPQGFGDSGDRDYASFIVGRPESPESHPQFSKKWELQGES